MRTLLLSHKKIIIECLVLLLLLFGYFKAIDTVFGESDYSMFDVDPSSGEENTHGFDSDPYQWDNVHAFGAPTEAENAAQYSFGSPEWYFNTIVEYSSTSQVTDIDKSLEGYNSRLNEAITKICENVCKPFGYVILTLFALLEIFNIVTARDAIKGEAMAYSFIRMTIRLIIAKVLVDNSRILLYAIFELTLRLITKAQSMIKTDPATLQALDSFFAELGNLSTFERLSASAVLMLVCILVIAANIICKVIVAGRFIAIYMLIAVSPIPLAFFSNEGQSEIGKAFIKRFFAECLQGFLIYLVVSLFPYIFSSLSDVTSMSKWLIGCVVNALVLITSVKVTSVLAKGIVNVM